MTSAEDGYKTRELSGGEQTYSMGLGLLANGKPTEAGHHCSPCPASHERLVSAYGLKQMVRTQQQAMRRDKGGLTSGVNPLGPMARTQSLLMEMIFVAF